MRQYLLHSCIVSKFPIAASDEGRGALIQLLEKFNHLVATMFLMLAGDTIRELMGAACF